MEKFTRLNEYIIYIMQTKPIEYIVANYNSIRESYYSQKN